MTLAACSSDPDSSEPANESSGPAASQDGSDLTGEVLISGSSTVEPITSIAAARTSTRPTPVSSYRSTVPAPATDSPSSARGDRHRRCVAPDQRRGDRPLRGGGHQLRSSSRSASTASASSPLPRMPTSPASASPTSTRSPAPSRRASRTGAMPTRWPTRSVRRLRRGPRAVPGGVPDITAPGEESGTYDTYVEFVIGDLAEARGADEATRARTTRRAADDNVIIENIGGSAEHPRAGSASRSPTRTATPSRRSRSTVATAASRRPPRRSRRASTR